MATNKADGRKQIEWYQNAEADNAVATATEAAVTGRTFYITNVYASFSSAVAQRVRVLDGTTEVIDQTCHNSWAYSGWPIRCTTGNKAEAILDASGTASNIGKLTIMGYWLDDE